MKIAFLVFALICVLFGSSAPAQELISHGRFHDVTLYKPKGAVKEFVLLLSGDGGWDEDAAIMARALVEQGAMVAGVSLPPLLSDFEQDTDSCVFPDGDLENLSHYIQGYAGLPGYFTPLLVGHASGAALAYAVITQAPADTFTGAISLGFCPHVPLKKPMCRGEGLRSIPGKDGHGAELLPTKKLRVPWTLLHKEDDPVCGTQDALDFAAKVRGSELVLLPRAGHNISGETSWIPDFVKAYNKLTAKRIAETPPAPVSLADLPVVEVPSKGSGDTLAILLSGDGGWAGIDKDVSTALAARGIPVAGFDTLRYFWNARTPERLTADLDRMLRYYTAHWKKSRVILIGYSQGANVLPFAITRLPADSKSLVGHAVLMGLGELASFEFHLGNWFGGDTGGVPILPEAVKLDAENTLCIYGEDEDDSLCPKIPAGHVHPLALPGGHHFDKDYDKLAEIIFRRISMP